jgi:hypothetical protein
VRSLRPTESRTSIYLTVGLALWLVGGICLAIGLAGGSGGGGAGVIGVVLFVAGGVFNVLAVLRIVDLFEQHVVNGQRTARAMERILQEDYPPASSL